MVNRHAQDSRRACHDLGELLDRVVIQAIRNSKAVAQRAGQHARAGRGRYQRELGDIQANRACRRTFADHDIERKVLHRGIQDLLDRTVETVDLVDKQHITRLQVGKDSCQVTGTRDGRTARRLNLGAQLVGDNRSQRGLTQARRTREDHVVERLATALRRFDQHAQTLLDVLLTAVVIQALRAQGAVDIEVLGRQLRAHHALAVRHGCRRRVAGRRP